MSLVSRARGMTGRPSNIRLGLQGLDAVAHSISFPAGVRFAMSDEAKAIKTQKRAARGRPFAWCHFLFIGVNDVLRTQHIKRGFYLQSAWLSQEPPCSQALQLW